MENLENISFQIENIHTYFSGYANKQVNYAYTLRNWLIGMYLFEFEQKGKNRAEYGDKLYKNLALKLKEKQIKGMSFTFLNTCKQFYIVYPQIIQTVSEQSLLIENHIFSIIQSVIENLQKKTNNQEFIIIQSLIEQFNSNKNESIQSLIGQFSFEK